jgi:hypothetical protein
VCLVLGFFKRLYFQAFINMQYNFSLNPDRADILPALRRRSCRQIKARAGKWWMDTARACCCGLFIFYFSRM